MSLPTCECFAGLPLNDKLDAIYCYYFTNAESTVGLPTCQCVKGQPLQDKITSIYCALLAQGGNEPQEITLEDITDLNGSWISVLQAPLSSFSIPVAQISDMSAAWKAQVVQIPALSSYFTTDGAGVIGTTPFANISITASQISDSTFAGRQFLMLTVAPSLSFVTLDQFGNVSTSEISAFTITLSQVSNMSTPWQTALALTPALNSYITTNGAGDIGTTEFTNITIQASQISNATTWGRSSITTPVNAHVNSFATTDSIGDFAFVDTNEAALLITGGFDPFNGTVSGAAAKNVGNGLILD